MPGTDDQIAAALGDRPPEIASLAQELRVYLKEETRPTIELAGQSAQSFNIGYGFTTTAWDCFCAIIVYRKHINLSFPSGAALEDPDGLLHGTGSRVRHLKLRELADVQTPAARALLAAARTKAAACAGIRDSTPGEVETVFKVRGR